MKKLLYSISGVIIIGLVTGGLWFVIPHQDQKSDLNAAPAIYPTKLNSATTSASPVAIKLKPKNKELLSYETDAESADECSSYEQFDDEDKVCYYECSSEKECSQIQNNIDQELKSWDDQAQQDQTPNNEKSADSGSEEHILAKYNVTKGESITFVKGDNKTEYRNLWSDVAALSPDKITDSYITTFEIYSDPGSDVIAYVNELDGSEKWRMVINVGAYKSQCLREQKMTLIHELGHIISLNSNQVNANVADCTRLQLDEGCANLTSYVERFWETFWKNLSGKTPAYDAKKYVDEYATTNETEDWAETFAFFVVGNQDSTNNSIRAQKINMFYTFPDLVVIRTDMRNVLGRDIVRARKVESN